MSTCSPRWINSNSELILKSALVPALIEFSKEDHTQKNDQHSAQAQHPAHAHTRNFNTNLGHHQNQNHIQHSAQPYQFKNHTKEHFKSDHKTEYFKSENSKSDNKNEYFRSNPKTSNEEALPQIKNEIDYGFDENCNKESIYEGRFPICSRRPSISVVVKDINNHDNEIHKNNKHSKNVRHTSEETSKDSEFKDIEPRSEYAVSSTSRTHSRKCSQLSDFKDLSNNEISSDKKTTTSNVSEDSSDQKLTKMCFDSSGYRYSAYSPHSSDSKSDKSSKSQNSGFIRDIQSCFENAFNKITNNIVQPPEQDMHASNSEKLDDATFSSRNSQLTKNNENINLTENINKSEVLDKIYEASKEISDRNTLTEKFIDQNEEKNEIEQPKPVENNASKNTGKKNENKQQKKTEKTNQINVAQNLQDTGPSNIGNKSKSQKKNKGKQNQPINEQKNSQNSSKPTKSQSNIGTTNKIINNPTNNKNSNKNSVSNNQNKAENKKKESDISATPSNKQSRSSTEVTQTTEHAQASTKNSGKSSTCASVKDSAHNSITADIPEEYLASNIKASPSDYSSHLFNETSPSSVSQQNSVKSYSNSTTSSARPLSLEEIEAEQMKEHSESIRTDKLIPKVTTTKKNTGPQPWSNQSYYFL